MLDLNAAFEKYDDEFLKFDRIENPRHSRPDICAFLMLHDLVSSNKDRDMVCAAEHDEIWLEVDPEEVAANATEEQICDLIRCGVRYTDYGFGLFV